VVCLYLKVSLVSTSRLPEATYEVLRVNRCQSVHCRERGTALRHMLLLQNAEALPYVRQANKAEAARAKEALLLHCLQGVRLANKTLPPYH